MTDRWAAWLRAGCVGGTVGRMWSPLGVFRLQLLGPRHNKHVQLGVMRRGLYSEMSLHRTDAAPTPSCVTVTTLGSAPKQPTSPERANLSTPS